MKAESRGWFKAMRGDEALEMISKNPNAFILAYIIAWRARWRDGFNEHGLGQGEAMLGDFEKYGMTRQQYRTAKHFLAEWHFATFRITNAGTIGKLIDSRLFSTSIDDDQPPNQLASNHRATTNEEGKKERRNQKPLGTSQRIGLEKRLGILKARLRDVEDDTADLWQREAYPEKVRERDDLRVLVVQVEKELLA